MCKYTVPLQNTLRQMQCVDILKYTTTPGTSSVEEHVPITCTARDSVPVCNGSVNCQLDRI